jgi:signal transduction histidine kinase
MRVAFPTLHRVPALAAGTLMLVVIAWLVVAPQRAFQSIPAELTVLALALATGILIRHSAVSRRADRGHGAADPANLQTVGPRDRTAPVMPGDPLESLPDGILLASAALKVMTVNAAFRQLAGLTETPTGASIGNFLARTDQTVDAAFLEGVTGQPVPAEVVRQDGKRLSVEFTFARLRDGSYAFCVRDCEASRRTESELRQSRAQFQRLTRRLSSRIEEERCRIAREVHDELGQQLVRLRHDVAWLQVRQASVETAERIAALGEVIDETAAIVRRIASELRPSVLDELGLSAAVEWLVLDFGRRSGLAVSLSLDEAADVLANGAATSLFRILQEALTNVAKHAGARRVHVRLLRMDGAVCLEVRDDGRGVRPADIADPSRLGLLGMKERADAFGGSIQVTAMPDAGTTVLVQLPIGSVGTMRIA